MPYAPLKISPTATSLHYGLTVYDSMNLSINTIDGKVQAFRPYSYLKSFLDSSEHLDMPVFEIKELLGCVKELAKLDKEWIPKESNSDSNS